MNLMGRWVEGLVRAIGVIGLLEAPAAAEPCAPGAGQLSGTVTGGSAATAGGVFRELCEPIGPIGNDNLQSNDLVAFHEQRSVTLQAPLQIGSTVLAAGETVSSYYVVFDPNAITRVVGTVTFAEPIVAIASTQAELAASDFLGDVSTQYLNPDARGLESGDTAKGLGGKVLSVDLSASSPGDSVRVITSAVPAKPPANVCDDSSRTLSGAVTDSAAATAGGKFIQLCDPIGDVGNDNFQTSDLYAFAEKRDVVIDAPLGVDLGSSKSLPPGTVLTSYYVVFDPGPEQRLEGHVDFPQPIIGVETSLARLGQTDFLGNPTARYLNPSARGLEAGDDQVRVSNRRLVVSLYASSPGDSIRVLTGFIGAPGSSADAGTDGGVDAGAGGQGVLDGGARQDAGSSADASTSEGAGAAGAGGSTAGFGGTGGSDADATASGAAGGVDTGGASGSGASSGGGSTRGPRETTGCDCRAAAGGIAPRTLTAALGLSVLVVMRRRKRRG